MSIRSLAEHLARVPDWRQAQGKRHPLGAILNLVSVAVLSGMRGLSAIAQFGRLLSASQVRDLGFTRAKTPSKSTLSVVLRGLDLPRLEGELRPWSQSYAGDNEPVALDGKTLRGSADGALAAVHLLTCFAVSSGVPLAQVPVNTKTNEHKAALEWLRELPLAGRVLTADAMFTHRDFCEETRKAGGDYLLPVKENQATLQRDIQAAFTPEAGLSPPTTRVAGTGRAAGQFGDERARPRRQADDPDDDSAQ